MKGGYISAYLQQFFNILYRKAYQIPTLVPVCSLIAALINGKQHCGLAKVPQALAFVFCIFPFFPDTGSETGTLVANQEGLESRPPAAEPLYLLYSLQEKLFRS